MPGAYRAAREIVGRGWASPRTASVIFGEPDAIKLENSPGPPGQGALCWRLENMRHWAVGSGEEVLHLHTFPRDRFTRHPLKINYAGRRWVGWWLTEQEMWDARSRSVRRTEEEALLTYAVGLESRLPPGSIGKTALWTLLIQLADADFWSGEREGLIEEIRRAVKRFDGN